MDDEGNPDKDVIRLTLWKHKRTGALAWRWKAHPELRPLYNLHQIAAHPDSPILVVEGEKSADTAAKLFSDHVITTSPGGCQAAGKTDWMPLKGRDVIIWPDADDPGRKYADTVARLAHEAGASSVKILPILDGKTSGWDAADAVAESWTPERAAGYLTSAKPWIPTATNVIPADATATAQEDNEDDLTPASDSWPEPQAEAAFHGLAGEFVRLVEPHTESDPVALLTQFLVCFGNAIGLGPHWTVNATDHHLNLFVNLVGQTARGRKGTSLDIVLNFFRHADEVWRRGCISSGLRGGIPRAESLKAVGEVLDRLGAIWPDGLEPDSQWQDKVNAAAKGTRETFLVTVQEWEQAETRRVEEYMSGIRETVARWPDIYRRRFALMVKGFQNGDREMGINVHALNLNQTAEKAFRDLSPFVKEIKPEHKP